MTTPRKPPAPFRAGKVRDIYRVGDDRLLLVASDRVSAFDAVLPTPVPGKGKVLNQLAAFWFRKLAALGPHHLLSTDFADFPEELRPFYDRFAGRSSLVRRAAGLPVEAVVRGYLAGHAWEAYQARGHLGGVTLPPGLRRGDRLPEPVFTPTTKAVPGEHDENISFARCASLVGGETAARLRERSLALYRAAADFARARGLIIADAKFEFGHAPDGTLLLIDEIFTPDCARFWEAGRYHPGDAGQESLDKQFVRDHLLAAGWNRQPPAPPLPAAVVAGLRERYHRLFRLLTDGEPSGWAPAGGEGEAGRPPRRETTGEKPWRDRKEKPASRSGTGPG